MDLTPKEIEAFNGLNESYIEMEKQLRFVAPKCHFKAMSFEDGEDECWWACDHCGHTKPA